MSGLESHLSPGETLLWEGRPAHVRRIGLAWRVIAIAGWVMFGCGVLVLLLGVANLDEMDGAMGLWIGYLVFSLALFAAFSIAGPIYARRANARVRYGVTGTRAVILQPTGGLLRSGIPAKGTIERRDEGRHGWAVLYAFPKPRQVRGRDGRWRTTRPAPIGFRGLTEADAKQAKTALAAIRGKA